MRLRDRVRPDAWVCLALVLAVAAAYARTGRAGYINFDDQLYVYKNPYVLQGFRWSGIRWAFTAFWASNWHPLTWLSHMADISLFGEVPGRFHLVSAAFHAGNSVLVYLLFRTMTGSVWRSALVAALFALHPAHVESVAWIAERKDVLSTFLALGAIHGYVHYTRTRSRAALALAAVWYAGSLLAKPMPVSVPILLLMLDHWPLGRTKGATLKGRLALVWEKWPFILLAAGSCWITILAQRQAIISLAHRDMGFRTLNASWAYMRYLGITFWPRHLIPFYPGILPSEWGKLGICGALSFLGLILITGLVIQQRNRRPYLVVGWVWFLVSLLPTIGFVQVGSQAMADRYTYVPLLGPFAAVVWGGAECCAAWRIPARIQAAVAAVLVGTLGVLTWIQAGHWRSGETLFRYTVQADPGNPMGLVCLAQNVAAFGRDREALTYLLEAQRLWPTWDLPYKVLGFVYHNLGERKPALDALARGLILTPNDTDMMYLAATDLMFEGRLEQAVTSLRRYLALEPQRMAATLVPAAELRMTQEARLMLGQCCRELHWAKEACRVLEQARRQDPADPQILINLGLALGEAGRPADALEPLRRCAELRPRWPEPHASLAENLDRLGRPAEAERERRRAGELAHPPAAGAPGPGRPAPANPTTFMDIRALPGPGPVSAVPGT